MQIIEAGPYTRPELNEMVGEFVSQRLFGRPNGFTQFGSLAVFDGSEIVAGAVFHDWHEDRGVVEISIAALTPRWLTRAVLQRLHSFPFDHLKCQMAIMRVSAKNERALRILRRLGFQMTTIERLRGRNEAEVICTLTDNQWRATNGKCTTAATP